MPSQICVKEESVLYLNVDYIQYRSYSAAWKADQESNQSV